MKMMIAGLLLVAATQTTQDRFRLFNECEPMDLLVILEDDAAGLGLTEGRVRTLAESRLRAARLFSDETVTYLLVYVNVAGRAFSLAVEYRKLVYDAASQELGLSTTWSDGATGTHGGGGTFIVQSLSEALDGFVLEYLRVNEDACR